MTVKQLIRKLQKCKPNSSVYAATLVSGCNSFNILKEVATEEVVFSPRKFRGREVVALINLDSMPFLKDNIKLKVVK